MENGYWVVVVDGEVIAIELYFFEKYDDALLFKRDTETDEMSATVYTTEELWHGKDWLVIQTTGEEKHTAWSFGTEKEAESTMVDMVLRFADGCFNPFPTKDKIETKLGTQKGFRAIDGDGVIAVLGHSAFVALPSCYYIEQYQCSWRVISKAVEYSWR